MARCGCCKVLQRHTYSFLGRRHGMLVCVLGIFFTINTLSWTAFLAQRTYATSTRCPGAADNIGKRDFSPEMCTGAIDAVYTWVNGSDPVWLASFREHKEAYLHSEALRAAPAFWTKFSSVHVKPDR